MASSGRTVHRSEQAILGSVPVRRYGWFVQLRGEEHSIHPFSSAIDQERFAAAAGAVAQRDARAAEGIATALALISWGNRTERDFGRYLLTDVAWDYSLDAAVDRLVAFANTWQRDQPRLAQAG